MPMQRIAPLPVICLCVVSFSAGIAEAAGIQGGAGRGGGGAVGGVGHPGKAPGDSARSGTV